MIGDKIKERRIELGLTQAQLSKATDIKNTTISNYENNISSPNEENIFRLMKALKCDANYLFEWDEIEDMKISYVEKKQIKKYRTLDEHGKRMVDFTLNEEYTRCTQTEKTPTIDLPFSLLKASAGTGDWLDDEQLDTISVFDTPEARKADIVIEVDGNSMLPDFSDGDRVFVRLQPCVYENDIGIFFVDGCGYIKKMGNNELISTNPEFDNIPIYDYTNFRCIGKVIGKV